MCALTPQLRRPTTRTEEFCPTCCVTYSTNRDVLPTHARFRGETIEGRKGGNNESTRLSWSGQEIVGRSPGPTNSQSNRCDRAGRYHHHLWNRPAHPSRPRTRG